MKPTFKSDADTPGGGVAMRLGEINYSLERLKQDEGERVHIRRELALIKNQYSIENSTVLELGCGVGSNLEVFRSDNRVLGVEGVGTAVEEARRRGLEIYCADLDEDLCMESEPVDWVLCLDVLEHLKNPGQLMREIRRLLRPGGHVVINVPNHFDLTGRLKILLGHDLDVHKFFPENREWDNPHLRFFTHRGICDLLAVTGFQIVEDRSPRFWSFPKGQILARVGLNPLFRALASFNPGLFARGLMLIGQR